MFLYNVQYDFNKPTEFASVLRQKIKFLTFNQTISWFDTVYDNKFIQLSL